MGRSAYCVGDAASARCARARPLEDRAACLDRRAGRPGAAPPEVDLALRVELPPLQAQEPRVRMQRALDALPVARYPSADKNSSIVSAVSVRILVEPRAPSATD